MSASVSAVVVHYRVPDLAAEAVSAVRRDCAGAAIECEVVLVDNGSDPGDRDALERLADRFVVPGENLGYAGGLGAGVEESRGETLLLMNPDVLVRPGCIAGLVAALDAGAGVAGPRFFWDRGRRFLLPPTEERTRHGEILARLARLGEGPARLHRRRWRSHARRHWLADGPLVTESLSGALLATRRSTWRRVGAFDPGYRLYFEESDWLRRCRRLGVRSVYVPAAEAVHLYDRSASREPRSSAWFTASRRRFERRWYGAATASVLQAADRLPHRIAEAAPVESRKLAIAAAGLRPPLWVELSPSPLGVPAVAERIGEAASWHLPEELWDRLAPGRYRLQVVDARGAEGAAHGLVKDHRAGRPTGSPGVG